MKKISCLLVAALFVLPISLLNAQDSLSLYNVNGWSYGGAWCFTDMLNTGMRIEDGGFGPSDSVQRFNSYGWTCQPAAEWVLQNSFGKFHLPNGPYPLPRKVLVDFNIINIENTWFFGLSFGLMDTTNGGYQMSLLHSVPIVSGWQTVESTGCGTCPPEWVVSMIAMDFALFSTDSNYVGVELQANNCRFVYENGDTILVDPFQYDWYTDVEPIPNIKPDDFVLSQNYPNPFNPSTKISWQSPIGSWQTLKVYDVLGNEVATLIDEYKPAGNYEVEFKATDLPSGVYFYKLQAGSFVETKKMLLLR